MTEQRGRKRILILGGGFGGVNTAMAFSTALKRRTDIEVALINDEIAQMEVEFEVLSDPLQSSASKFFTIRKSDGG